MQADTSACSATASICLAASRTISSSTEPLASSGSASSWTTLSMGVPSRPARQRRHMIRLAMGYRSSSGRCAPSRHPAEDHPQVLIIAQLVDEEYEDTAVGRFLRNTKGFMNELEREGIRERTSNGRKRRVREGKMMPGPLPLYGYAFADVHKTAYILDPYTAPIIQRIFADVAAGKTLERIKLELTREGI